MTTFRDKKGIRRKVCDTCLGGGSLTQHHVSGNPELERYIPCPSCCGDGSVRCDPFDPLETLGAERRGIVSLRGRPAFLLASANRYYNQAKARAMAPVYLP